MLGVTSTKAFGFILNFGYSYSVLKLAELSALKMLVGLSEDASFIKEIKYLSMTKAGVSEDKIDIIKIIDDQTMKNWKDTVIKKIIHAHPNSYRGSIPYDSWEGALKHLDKITKKKD